MSRFPVDASGRRARWLTPGAGRGYRSLRAWIVHSLQLQGAAPAGVMDWAAMRSLEQKPVGVRGVRLLTLHLYIERIGKRLGDGVPTVAGWGLRRSELGFPLLSSRDDPGDDERSAGVSTRQSRNPTTSDHCRQAIVPGHTIGPVFSKVPAVIRSTSFGVRKGRLGSTTGSGRTGNQTCRRPLVTIMS